MKHRFPKAFISAQLVSHREPIHNLPLWVGPEMTPSELQLFFGVTEYAESWRVCRKGHLYSCVLMACQHYTVMGNRWVRGCWLRNHITWTLNSCIRRRMSSSKAKCKTKLTVYHKQAVYFNITNYREAFTIASIQGISEKSLNKHKFAKE